MNCFLLISNMPRCVALLLQRGVCGAGWGRMWWCGGGSEPLLEAGADCAGSALRRSQAPLNKAAGAAAEAAEAAGRRGPAG